MFRGEEMEENTGKNPGQYQMNLEKIKEYIPKKQRDPSKHYWNAPG